MGDQNADEDAMNTTFTNLAITVLSLSKIITLSNGEERVILWRDLYAGMPKTEVKAAYPKYKAELYPGCPVRVLSTYKNGGLMSVILLGSDKSAPCYDNIMKDMTSNYGEGKVSYENQMAFPLGVGAGLAGVGSFKRKDMTWHVGDVWTTLALMHEKQKDFNFIISVGPDWKGFQPSASR